MPTYDYICDACGHEFEAFESIKADPQTVCPECHEPKLRRKIGAGAAILFKGSGFYQTDYRSDRTRRPPRPTSRPTRRPSRPATRRRRPRLRSSGERVRARPSPTLEPRELACHDPGTLPDLLEAVRDRALDDLPTLPVLLRPLPADRPRPLDRRRRTPSPGGPQPSAVGRRREDADDGE